MTTQRSDALARGALRALVLAGALTAAAGPALAQGPIKPVALAVVDVRVVATGYRVSQMIGRAVTNDRNENIGKMDDLIVGRDRVLFAIIGVGGFLGLGEKLVAVPYTSLTVSRDHIVLPGGSKDELTKLPAFHYGA